MDAAEIVKTVIENWDYAAGVGALGFVLFFQIGKIIIAKIAARLFEQSLDFILETGNAKWDAVILHANQVLEDEIPDKITWKHPRIEIYAIAICKQRWLLKGHEEEVAKVLAAVAHAIDTKAKSYKKNNPE